MSERARMLANDVRSARTFCHLPTVLEFKPLLRLMVGANVSRDARTARIG